ncbi:MAG: hypothetical protein IAE82_01570 [Opitutaceae bacterium]|nr:hypothetical protein [Opitutaceae bacterium]
MIPNPVRRAVLNPAVSLLAAIFVAAAVPVRADLDPRNDPVDPTKRAPIATSDAVRPVATQPVGTGAIGSGRLPVVRAPVELSPVATSRAPVVVTETRAKSVKRPDVRRAGASTSRSSSVKRAADQRATIPQLDRERFQRTLSDYRRGVRSAADMTHQRVRVDGKTVDIGEINRYASPRATLERQGIPVVSAGGQGEAQTDGAPIPLSSRDATPAE